MARSKKNQRNKGQVTNLLVIFIFIVTLLLTKDLFYTFGAGVLAYNIS